MGEERLTGGPFGGREAVGWVGERLCGDAAGNEGVLYNRERKRGACCNRKSSMLGGEHWCGE